MNIELILGNAADERAQTLVIPVFEGEEDRQQTIKELDKVFDGALSLEINRARFKAKTGAALMLPTYKRIAFSHVLLLGIGSKKKYEVDTVRLFGGALYKRLKADSMGSAVVQFEELSHGASSSRDLMGALAEGLMLASYTFDQFKSGKKKGQAVKKVLVCAKDKRSMPALERGLEEARVLADGVRFARELVNMPPSEMHPAAMVEAAKSIASESKQVKVKVFDQERMEKLGMRAALAVARGSDHPPYGVHMTYTPKGKAKKKIALVGKAVTFDSGGLSLKPSNGMMTMKIDMGGAAAVLGLFKAIADLEPNVEVHGIFLAVENMPSGKAYRPGDVVTAMNGKSIEVLNTDAEGRVTLADALSYASRLKPDAIIDLATLTGACVSALGEDIAGLMTDDEKLAEKLLELSKTSGEPLWRLPLHGPYKELIQSKVADVKNIGGNGGGAITAGLFLSHFVDCDSWAHLDIAGPVFTEKETRPDFPYGATGYGVRLLARYLQAL
jgi:leucyl aminopeptidase